MPLLEARGFRVKRYNLARHPQAYAGNEAVKAALAQYGNRCLPLVLLDGAIVSKGQYPSRQGLARLAGLESNGPDLQGISKRCCG